MKKLTVLITSLTFISLSMGAHAHGFQNNRFGSHLGSYTGYSNAFNYPFYSTPYAFPYYPSNGLIVGITYRNYNSRIGLQNRVYNGRVSNNRIYSNRSYINGNRHNYGYRDDYQNNYSGVYRNDRRSVNNSVRSNRYNNNTCYEFYYDRYGNRVQRSLPASACRH